MLAAKAMWRRRRWVSFAVLLCLPACGGKKTYRVGDTDGSCEDGVQSGTETDVDCGGPACGGCPTDASCERHQDCTSGVCRADTCRAASCDDQTKNGAETDVDCGGDACRSCAAGSRCEKGSDCASRACDERACTEATCTDAVRNGDETDVDCGGSCASCERCDDGALNGTETDVDCGGEFCPQCELDRGCYEATDCTTGVCVGRDGGPTGNLCSQAHCGNRKRDENETDIDCGGPDCTPCSLGQSCASPSDCDSGPCDGFCTQPCQAAASDCGDNARCENELCVYCDQVSDCRPGMCGDSGPCVCKNGFCLPG